MHFVRQMVMNHMGGVCHLLGDKVGGWAVEGLGRAWVEEGKASMWAGGCVPRGRYSVWASGRQRHLVQVAGPGDARAVQMRGRGRPRFGPQQAERRSQKLDNAPPP